MFALLFPTLALLLVLWGGVAHSQLEDESRPNLLLISVDTLRADSTGLYGDPTDHTPHLDALARRGTVFANA